MKGEYRTMEKVSDLIKNHHEIVLMSLWEEYFEEMLSGIKRYEYRKRYRKVPTKAFIYISKTKKSIGALIEFGQPIFGTATEIAKLSESEQAGTYKAMEEYLSGGKGIAIPIKAIYQFEPIHLDELKKEIPEFVAPQSYYLLDDKIKLLDLLKEKEIRTAHMITSCGK